MAFDAAYASDDVLREREHNRTTRHRQSEKMQTLHDLMNARKENPIATAVYRSIGYPTKLPHSVHEPS